MEIIAFFKRQLPHIGPPSYTLGRGPSTPWCLFLTPSTLHHSLLPKPPTIIATTTASLPWGTQMPSIFAYTLLTYQFIPFNKHTCWTYHLDLRNTPKYYPKYNVLSKIHKFYTYYNAIKILLETPEISNLSAWLMSCK